MTTLKTDSFMIRKVANGYTAVASAPGQADCYVFGDLGELFDFLLQHFEPEKAVLLDGPEVDQLLREHSGDDIIYD